MLTLLNLLDEEFLSMLGMPDFNPQRNEDGTLRSPPLSLKRHMILKRDLRLRNSEETYYLAYACYKSYKR